MKNSQIILCKNIKMDKNYTNVLNYSETNLLSICEANKLEKATNYSFVKPNGNTIDVSFSYSNCLKSNYIAFQNPYYDNKWFFAFVDSVEYRNNSLTRITFTIDVFSTWFNKVTLQTCYVEREHVNDDTVGANTIPEGVELGDYITTSEGSMSVYNSPIPCIAVTRTIAGAEFGGSKVGGLFGGLAYYYCDTDVALGALKALYDINGKGDDIKDIFYIDKGFTQNATTETFEYEGNSYTVHQITIKSNIAKDIIEISKETRLDNYTPNNKKLLTFPYCYLMIDNNSGNANIYKYEDFVNIEFLPVLALTAGGSTRLTPLSYKGVSANYSESLSCAKLPVCNFNSSTYANWFAKNGTNIGLNILGSAGQMAGVGLVASAVNPAVAGVGITSALISATQSINQLQKSELLSPSIQGNLNNGDVSFLMGLYNPRYYKRTIKREYARMIDIYFGCFGYKINRTKIPNITGRLNWNYVKTTGCNFTGEMSSSDLETIRKVFDRGVTIWHNYDTMLNYNASNTIV